MFIALHFQTRNWFLMSCPIAECAYKDFAISLKHQKLKEERVFYFVYMERFSRDDGINYLGENVWTGLL
jgi:hypothetical protein